MKHAHHSAGRGAKAKAQAQTQAKSSPASAASGVAEGDLELQIREAAYFRYLARGAAVGHEMEDWLQAEAELLEAETPQPPEH